MNSNLVEVQYIIWSHLRKKDGTTGVCWEKWHRRRMDAHTYEKRPTKMQQASHNQTTNKILSHFYQLI
jgi:hypothetical protein